MLQKIVDNKIALAFVMISAYAGAVAGIAGGFYTTYLLVTWIGASP